MKTKQVWKIGDCLELLPGIPDKSIDMILTDMPYGSTGCAWDMIIDLYKLWPEYKRIIKDNGAIVLTATQPFASALILSNIEMFKYEWIWEKSHATGHLNVNKQPMRAHENVLVFYKNQCTYNPQMFAKNKNAIRKRSTSGDNNNKGMYGAYHQVKRIIPDTISYPMTIQYFAAPFKGGEAGIHPTQKPLSLYEFLIKTYTNEGNTVHDSCLGSGTTLEACLNTNRNCIGFEISDEWEDHYRKRLRLYDNKLEAYL